MKYRLRYWIFTLVAAAASMLASCSQTDEVMDNIPYGRVLAPLNFTAEVVKTSGTDVVFRWQVMQNAESFELQLFEAVDEYADADYESVEPLLSQTVSPDEVPYTLTGLEVDKDYYARVRGLSSKIENSNWSYLEKAFSTYPVRATLNPVVVKRTDSSIEIAWDDAADKGDLNAVNVDVVMGDGQTVRVEMTDDERNACSKVVGGLEPATEYTLTLIFGKAGERGSVTAWTRPQTGTATRVTSAAEIAAALDGASGAVELLVAYSGEAYDFTTSEGNAKNFTVKVPLKIYGETSEDGKKPVLRNIAFTADSVATTIRLEELSLDGGKSGGSTVTMNAGDYTAVEVVNCEMYDYTKGIYSASSKANVGKILFKGVYAHDINANGKEAGDFIDIRDGENKYIEILNSTFYACARTFLRLTGGTAGSVAVRNCTFNYVTTADAYSSNNRGIFSVSTTTNPTSIVCEKCVFLNQYHDNEKEPAGDNTAWVRMCRNSTDSHAPVCDGNFYYNVGVGWWASKATLIADGTAFSEEIGMKNGKMLSADPCVNSAAGKLYLVDGAIAEAGVGDPRWWSAKEPVVERAKSLETVTEPTVWDFTDATKFDTESIEANTIIENIRIYAPAQVVMGKGISFPSTATVGEEGEPTSSALGFRALGIGSVKVTTADGGYNASVHVVVGSDRYTVPADGKEHSVPFGDISGENDIYVLAGSAVTVTRLEWSDDLTPDAVKRVLDTPKVALSASSFEVGNEENIDINVTWTPVDNAVDYVVTFNGAQTVVTTTSYTIAASAAAALAVGEYAVSVVARPVATSSKYEVSAAGEASFVVKEKPVVGGGEVTWTWDFASAAWQAEFAKYGAANTDITDWNLTYDGLTLYSANKSKYNTTFFQWGGKGSTDDRYLKFTAPAAGTLKVWSSNTGGGEDASREVTVQAGGKVTSHPGGSPSGTLTENTYDITEAGEVYIYCSGNALRFYKVEFTFVDGSAAPAEPTVWDFASTEWQAEFAKYGAANTDITDWNLTYDGLTLYSANKSKYNTTFFQWGGKGSTDDRYLKFTAASAGTLKVWSSNTGGGEDMSREVTVQAGGKVTSHPGGSPSGTLTENTYDITEAGEVYIYCSGNALRFYKVEFDGGVEK